MTTILGQERDLEFEAEIRELAKSFLPDPPAPAPPKPNVTPIEEGELSGDTLRERIERNERLLARDREMLAAIEKREARERQRRQDDKEETEAERKRKRYRADCERYGEAGATALIAHRQMNDWAARKRGEDQ
jgi:hypothetical protein